MSFAYSITDELTTKQKQALETVSKIVYAFYDKKRGIQTCLPRTWGDIKRLTSLSNAALSKHLTTLIKQRVVEKEKKQDDNGHIKTFYTYTRRVFSIGGKIGQTEIQPVQIKTERGTRTAYTFVPKKGSKQPSVLDVVRVYYDRDRIIGVKLLTSRKGKPTIKDASGNRKDRYLIDRVRPNPEDSAKS